MTDEVFRELIEGVLVSMDLLGLDVKKEFPNLWKEYLNLKEEQGNDWWNDRRIKES